MSLTDNQYRVARDAWNHPVILRTRGDKMAARQLERKGWGNVESGASGEVIFRMNEDGEALYSEWAEAEQDAA